MANLPERGTEARKAINEAGGALVECPCRIGLVAAGEGWFVDVRKELVTA